MSTVNLQRVTAVFVIAFFCRAVHKYVHLNQSCDRCEMSFMHPHYQPIQTISSQPTNPYRLLEYSEDGRFDKLSSNIYIYVPGNAASFQQVRSVGAELLKRCTECNVYAMDTGEELSAFDMDAVWRQSRFLGDVIDGIVKKRPHARFTIIGHSMGAIVARLAACKHAHVDKIVDIASPTQPPTPSMSAINLFKSVLRCDAKTITIGAAVNDIQAVSTEPNRIRVDTIPLSWSDPHHQAMVWSHSLMRALADHLVFGADLTKFGTSMVQQTSHNTAVCNAMRGLSGTYMTNLKLHRDFDIKGEMVNASIVPGKYQPATSGKVKSVIPEYLTLISGHGFSVNRYCEPSDGGEARTKEYHRHGSVFADYLTVGGEAKRVDFLEKVILHRQFMFCLPNAIYEKQGDTLASVALPNGQTIHPEKRMLTDHFGRYTITSIDHPVTFKLDISRTIIHWINLNKSAFHRGLILGFHKRTPLVYCMLIVLLMCSFSSTPLLGYLLGQSLFVLLFGKGIKFPPIYKYSDDIPGFKLLCTLLSFLSLFLPYPSSILTCIPVFAIAFFDNNKRWKAMQWTLLAVFEIISGIASAIDIYRTQTIPTGYILHKVIPLAINMSMAMHVRSFIFMPLATCWSNVPLASSLVAVVCAWSAADHERNLAKNLRNGK